MKLTAAALAEKIGASLEGDPEVIITAPARIEEAGEGNITFLANLAYEHHLYGSAVSAVLVSRDYQPKGPVAATLLRVDNVSQTVNDLLAAYQQNGAVDTRRTISKMAAVEDSAVLGKDVRIGKFSIVGEASTIGDGTTVHDQVFIGKNCKIGSDCVLLPGVKLMDNCELGDRVVLQPNVVIGGDGFGFTPNEAGVYQKVAHIGNVVVESDVEIGANTTVDRAVMGSTILRRGVKLDNLIQVGHNVEIGENTVIAAHTGISGSTRIGANCRVGGQVGFAGHLTIADGTQIQGQSGVGKTIEEPGGAIGGSPAFSYREYLRSVAVFSNLPQLYRDVARLKRKEEETES